ncbi:MAG TPA: alpha-ketoacid dehydrogenase subunit beta [Acidimicrobiales bacterium]|nr:alpha-ketoacid dehydrogenase subunit beta [Acidimicrobiales bacterium]
MSGEAKERKLSTAQAIHEALDLAMEKDPTVLLLGEDVSDPSGGGVFHISEGLSTKHGEHRVRSTPIAEQAIVGAAIGAAVGGFRPVAELMFMDFFAVAMDQISNHAAKLRYMSGGQTGVPITIRTAAGAGMQFGAQHSEMLEAWVTHIPGLKVVVASNPADAKGLLTSAIFDDDPVITIEPTLNYWVSGPVPEGEYSVPLGQASVARPGDDVTVITWGREVAFALQAAEQLAGEGVSAEVIDLRSLVPMDERAILESVGRTKRAVIAHQAVRRNGLGAEIACLLNEHLFGELQAPVVRVAGPNTPIPYAAELESLFVVDTNDIAEGIRRATK